MPKVWTLGLDTLGMLIQIYKMNYQDLKIIFLGTPEFAVPVLKKLIASDLKPGLVITQPDKPVGRKQELMGPPIKQLALANDIKVVQPSNKKELAELFKNLEVDICVLVAYGMIIPEEVLTKPKLGFVNLHPSKLPKYRGPSPIQAAILHGETKTALTIMKLNKEMDAGPIIAQQDMAIDSADTYIDLANKLSEAGAELMVSILPKYLADEIELVDQDDSQATYCSLVKRDDGRINWSKSALEIYRQFKAFYEWPGVFTYIDKKRLKIANLDVLEGDFGRHLTDGEVFLGPKGELLVKCGDGSITLLAVQLEGKNQVSGQEFLHGQSELIGKKLGV